MREYAKTGKELSQHAKLQPYTSCLPNTVLQPYTSCAYLTLYCFHPDLMGFRLEALKDMVSMLGIAHF